MPRLLTRAGLCALFGLLPFVLTSCDLSEVQNIGEDLKLIIQLPEVTTSISGQILNPATGEPVAAAVYVSIEGKDRNLVVDPLLGDPVTERVLEGGFLALALKEGVRPAPNAPIEFNVVAQAEGYFASSVPVRLTGEGQHPFALNLVAFDETPEGVSATEQTAGRTGNTGDVAAAFSVTTPAEPNTRGTASISVPAGTKVTDASGRPLVGSLTTAVAYHNNRDGASLRAFPGGFSNVSVRTSNNSTPSGAFITGGFVSVEMTDAAGRKAERFSTPIDVTITVPGGSFNPETGGAVKNGDVIPVWSYDPAKGTWTEEGRGTTVGPDAHGNFTLVFKAPHLSYWNLDWFSTDTCGYEPGLRFDLTGNPDGLPLTLRFTGPGFSMEKHVYGDAEPFFYNFPRALRDVTVEAVYQGRVVGTTTVASPCGAQATLAVDLPAPSTLVMLDVEVRGYCENRPELDFRPSLPLWYSPAGQQSWQYLGYMVGGKIRVPGVELGGHYRIATEYEGKRYEKDLTVEGTPVDGVLKIARDFVGSAEDCASF